MANEEKTLKVAVFGHKRIPSREGGVEIVVQALSQRMVKLGHSVTCYNRAGHHVGGARFDAQKRKEFQGIRLRTVPTVDKKGLAAVSSSFFAAVCSAFSKADVVHIHAEGPALMCWLPKLFGKKVIVTVHGLDWQREKWKTGFASKYLRAGERMAVRYADEIIVLSRNVRKYFSDTYNRHTHWIPNAVEPPTMTAARQILRQFGVEKDGYILFLGRLVPEKGVHYLLEAYKNLNTDKKLVIAGGTSDTDDYVQRLKDMAGQDGRILFTGFVQGALLQELYSNAYIYVLPSDVEGMPLSLLEAMSYGNCCVVSDIAECTEVVEDRAVVFRRANPDDLRKCLQRLCDDPQETQAYRSGAADYILKKYNWDRITEKTLALYR